MGLFSSKTVVSRSYDVIALKDATSLQGDLWRNTKLQLFKAYQQNGIEGYSKTAWHMLHKIRKKFSTDYMVKAGVATENTFTAYTYDKDKLEQKLRNMVGNQTVVLESYKVDEESTDINDMQYVLGDLTNVKCKVAGANGVYAFIINGGNTSRTLNSVNSTTDKVLVISKWGNNYETRIEPVPIAMATITATDITGIMHPTDALEYMEDYQNQLWYWLKRPRDLIGTIEDGSLIATKTVIAPTQISDSITTTDGTITTVGVVSEPTNTFGIDIVITGKAKSIINSSTSSSSTTDSDTVPEDTSTSSSTESTDTDYYNIDETTITQTTNVGEYTAVYSVVGDRKTITTTIETKTYTAGTRIDDDGNEVNTVTEVVRDVTVTEYEPVGYKITVIVTQPVISCMPLITTKRKPTIAKDSYVNYRALDLKKISAYDFIKTAYLSIPSGSGWQSDTVISIANKDTVGLQTVLINENILIDNPNTKVVRSTVGNIYIDSYQATAVFTKSPLEQLTVDTVTVTGKKQDGTIVKAQIQKTPQLMEATQGFVLTPVITLRYAKKTLYTHTAKKTDKLKKVLNPLGIDNEGVDNLIDTVSDNADVYTASIVSGLRIFNEDKTLVTDDTHARAKIMYMLADMITGNGMVLDTAKTYHIHSYSMDASYTYTIEQNVIDNFDNTDEYGLLNITGHRKKYYMRTVREVIESYSYTTCEHDEEPYDVVVDVYSQIVYVYRIVGNTAYRYKYHDITMTLTSADGSYTVTTKNKVNNSWFNHNSTPSADLQKLIIIYPEVINRKLSIKEYSAIFNDNIFLFIYARKVTKVKWYQRGFFGFILIIATIAIMIAFPALGALKGFAGYLVAGAEAMVVGYGLSVMFPNMSPWVQMILTIVIMHGANLAAKSLATTTAEAATKTITIDNIIADIKTYITKMSTLDKILMGGNLVTTGYQEYVKGEMEDAMEYTEKYIDMVSKATKKLDDKMREFGVQEDSVAIFADSMLDMVEGEMYDEVEVSDVYMSVDFGSKMLSYVSSVDYQADKLDVNNLNHTNIMV